ncbi:MAG: patatin family protein [Lachnospiraceae bacterium]|nr:patatin family protein [Lachnospiraceae bacterium]
MINAALVLEGGALRGMFTAGVLDVLLDQEMEFAYVNGVSAGSLNGINYVSKQNGRSRDVNLNYVNDPRYLGVRNIVRNGGIFNFKFLFGELSDELLPFDARTFFASEQRFEVVATNCHTGMAEYFEKGKEAEIMRASAASSSMPVVSSMINLNGSFYLDGGIAEPVAYRRAMEQGYDKLVLVLTRQAGYEKPPTSKAMKLTYERRYRRYPELAKRLVAVPEHYNEMQKEITALEQAGKLFVIRPQKPVEISRVEKDVERLRRLYEEGRAQMEARMEAMCGYLGLS